LKTQNLLLAELNAKELQHSRDSSLHQSKAEDTMHAVALHFPWDREASSAPHVPKLLVILVSILTVGSRFLNWILTPLHRIQDTPHDPLTLWPITPFTRPATATNSSSSIHNPPKTNHENLPAVIEYGSLGADRQEDITCSVCLTDFRATDRIRQLAKCEHVFHMECLDKWIDYQRHTCPLCRSPSF